MSQCSHSRKLWLRNRLSAYTSMISLINVAGYNDISSFVREAVLVKCKDIANDVAVMMNDRAIANQKSSYKPIEYVRE